MFKLPNNQILYLTRTDSGFPLPNIVACHNSHFLVPAAMVWLVPSAHAAHKYAHKVNASRLL